VGRHVGRGGDPLTYKTQSFDYHCVDRVLEAHEINYIVRGSVRGQIEGEPVNFGSGDLFWMAPGVKHTLLWPKNLKHHTMRFVVSSAGKHLAQIPRTIILKRQYPLLSPVRAFIEAGHQGRSPHGDECMRATSSFVPTMEAPPSTP
jgi:hypothetical protein